MRGWIFLAPMMVAACSGSYEPPRLTEKQTSKLEAALAGKVAGEKVSCISRHGQGSLIAISGNVLLYRMSGRLVYRNDLIGSCSGLTRGDTLIVETRGSQYCRGDMARSADLMTGIVSGACALGDFTPYRTPAR